MTFRQAVPHTPHLGDLLEQSLQALQAVVPTAALMGHD